MGGALTAALIGANMISGAGMLDFETCISFEKLVIDAEIIGMAKRVVAGVVPRDDPLALDLMREMGHRGDFLSHRHTRKWFREELYIPSKVIDRGSLEAWQADGSKSSDQRASERIEELINTYRPTSIPDDLRAELHQITSHAAQKFGMDKLPPLGD
jgi:trimethylamine--corrinoid protein Co-methyltransferase